MSDLADTIAQTVEDAAIHLVRSGAFDGAITGVIEDTIRKGSDQGLTETGFVLKMTVELIDMSLPRLSFHKAKRIAEKAYAEFLRDNALQFDTPGWDWSSAGARTVAHEYETDLWEPTP